MLCHVNFSSTASLMLEDNVIPNYIGQDETNCNIYTREIKELEAYSRKKNEINCRKKLNLKQSNCSIL